MINTDSFRPFLLNTGMCVHDADWNWKNVSSPFARLYYVTEGEAAVSMNGLIQKLTPGHMYIIPPFTTHSDICDGHFVHHYIHIYEDEMSEVRLFEDLLFPTEIEAGERELALFRRLLEINPDRPLPASDPVTYDNSEGLLMEMRRESLTDLAVKIESRGIMLQLVSCFLTESMRKTQADDNRIMEATTFIRRHLSEKLTTEMIADAAHLSKDHFTRVFKESVGETPMSYVTNAKIQQAQLLMTTTDLSVKQIAFKLGFDDCSYFIRTFKRVTGITPLRYRRDS